MQLGNGGIGKLILDGGLYTWLLNLPWTKKGVKVLDEYVKMTRMSVFQPDEKICKRERIFV